MKKLTKKREAKRVKRNVRRAARTQYWELQSELRKEYILERFKQAASRALNVGFALEGVPDGKVADA